MIDTTDLRGKVEAILHCSKERLQAIAEYDHIKSSVLALILSEKAEAWDEASSAIAVKQRDCGHGIVRNPYREVKP